MVGIELVSATATSRSDPSPSYVACWCVAQARGIKGFTGDSLWFMVYLAVRVWAVSYAVHCRGWPAARPRGWLVVKPGNTIGRAELFCPVFFPSLSPPFRPLDIVAFEQSRPSNRFSLSHFVFFLILVSNFSFRTRKRRSKEGNSAPCSKF